MSSGAADFVSKVSRRWNELWFREVPSESYVLLRILFGTIGLLSLFGLTPVSMYWPTDALAPLPEGNGFRAQLQALGLGTLAGWMFFLGLSAAFLCMAIGWASRWAVAACFAGSVLQTHWNYLPLSSAQNVLIAVLYCLVWADCSGAPSIDAWARNTTGEPSTQPIWPLRLIRIQVALIYFNSGLWKILHGVWRDGTAVHYATNHNIFHRFQPLPGTESLTIIATYVTLAWEIGFPLLVLWRRTRWIALGLGVLLHAGMWATLELGPFSFLMVGSYVAFLDPHRVSRFFADPLTALRVTAANGRAV